MTGGTSATVGPLTSGFYGIPLPGANAGLLVGEGGAVTGGGVGGIGAAGGMGSGMSGMTMPTAAETAAEASTPWWQTAANGINKGGKALATAGTISNALGGNKQAQAPRPAAMPFQGQPAQPISPYSGQQQASGNQFAEMLRRKLANSNNGLLE